MRERAVTRRSAVDASFSCRGRDGARRRDRRPSRRASPPFLFAVFVCFGARVGAPASFLLAVFAFFGARVGPWARRRRERRAGRRSASVRRRRRERRAGGRWEGRAGGPRARRAGGWRGAARGASAASGARPHRSRSVSERDDPHEDVLPRVPPRRSSGSAARRCPRYGSGRRPRPRTARAGRSAVARDRRRPRRSARRRPPPSARSAPRPGGSRRCGRTRRRRRRAPAGASAASRARFTGAIADGVDEDAAAAQAAAEEAGEVRAALDGRHAPAADDRGCVTFAHVPMP